MPGVEPIRVSSINAYAVPPDGDDAFVAGWERNRALLLAGGAVTSTALHRALRADVALRFVEVASVDSVDTWREAIGDPAVALPSGVRPSLYEAVEEDGEPEGAGGVVLVNPVEVPAGGDERFLESWACVREIFAARQGYLGTRLHRSLGPGKFRFVVIVRWSSPLMYARTLQQPEAGNAIAAMPFAGDPALYLTLRPAG